MRRRGSGGPGQRRVRRGRSLRLEGSRDPNVGSALHDRPDRGEQHGPRT